MIRHATAALAIALLLPTSLMADEHDYALAKLLPPGAKVEKLAGGMQFTEGPVWTDADGGYLIFSDIPASELKVWAVATNLATFRKDMQHPNGNTRDGEDRLVTCQHGSRCVVRMEKNHQTWTVVAQAYGGKKFNSPNDVVVKSDGTIWFTDPTYGLEKGQKKEQEGNFVFSVEPRSGRVTKVADGFEQPNGLCFSRDEKKLYIADSGKPHHIRVFDVVPRATPDRPGPDGRPTLYRYEEGDWQLRGGDVFCVIDNGVPDGIRCDERGNVWSSAGDGVHVFSPDGNLIGKISVAETPANLCFGGADGRTLFITARTSLYSIRTLVRGASRPAR